tara:strand:- start:3025 stop:3726 length:702 start_codon:yes stop_codon:yes gene_type:complete
MINENENENENENSKNKQKIKDLRGPGSKFIKMDPRSRKKDHYDTPLTFKEKITAIKGIILYIIIFIISIPYILYKLGLYDFLKLYFVNTDLLATVISFDKGYFKDIFKYLYNDTGSLVGFLSQSFINWSVLMGLFFITISESCKKSKSYTLSKLAFILLITYLLPSRYLIKIQNEIYNFLTNKKILTKNLRGLITILLGLILAISFIAFENLVIFLFSGKLKKVIDYLFKII